MKESVGKENLADNRVIYVPEYLVIFEHLATLAKEYDLELVERKNFHEFYGDNIEREQETFNRMVMKDGIKITEE